jgi:hypothetical protein
MGPPDTDFTLHVLVLFFICFLFTLGIWFVIEVVSLLVE